ncbi:MAG: hypothetical protein ACYCYP_06700 [Leptospirales bacterium]
MALSFVAGIREARQPDCLMHFKEREERQGDWNASVILERQSGRTQKRDCPYSCPVFGGVFHFREWSHIAAHWITVAS